MDLFEYALDHSKYHSETDMRMMMKKKLVKCLKMLISENIV